LPILFSFISLSSLASEVAIRAIVNGEIITSYDVIERAKLSKELLKINKYNLSDEEIEAKVLSEIIDDKIKMVEANRFGVRISPDELIDAKIRMEKYLELPAGGYKKLIEKLGIDESIVNKQVEADVIWMKFVYSVLRAYVKVSDSELNLLIDNTKNEKQYKYEISSIILPNKTSKSFSDDLKNISNCEDFIKFAKENGEQGSGLKLTLVDNQMDKKLASLLSHSEVSKATKPLEINGNNTVFFICDKQSFIHEFSDEEKEEFRFSILQNKLDAFSNKYFEKLKASAVIEIKK
ncbi:MAG: hypothetical protein IJ638_03140, partial [Alphaproteobacteria bacterium]|nr:hypothetical protein [Alphaproteobacteria bacterium]